MKLFVCFFAFHLELEKNSKMFAHNNVEHLHHSSININWFSGYYPIWL